MLRIFVNNNGKDYLYVVFNTDKILIHNKYTIFEGKLIFFKTKSFFKYVKFVSFNVENFCSNRYKIIFNIILLICIK